MTSVFEASHHSAHQLKSSSLVKGRALSISFDEKTLLDNVDFHLDQNESLVLIGPSGQGKTTVLKIMAGLIEPQSGELKFEGEDWSKLSITQRNYHYRKRGMLFQKNALFDSMSALENVCFPLVETSELPKESVEKEAQQLLKAVGLDHAISLFPDEMSGGMQKRLGIARALILQPPILLNDDPVAGLDPISSRKIIELILTLKKENNMTVVSVLNDINRAFELATRILYVGEGRVLDLGGPENALKYPNETVQRFLKGESN